MPVERVAVVDGTRSRSPMDGTSNATQAEMIANRFSDVAQTEQISCVWLRWSDVRVSLPNSTCWASSESTSEGLSECIVPACSVSPCSGHVACFTVA